MRPDDSFPAMNHLADQAVTAPPGGPGRESTFDGLFETVHVYSIPMTVRFRGISVREGMVFRGPLGWGEFCPFPEYDDAVAVRWLEAAAEAAVRGWPPPVRRHVPINVTVPVVSPERAHAIVEGSGCRTAKVKVADHPESMVEDCARLEAVRDAVGSRGSIRIDVNGAWDVDTAAAWLPVLDRAADGLEYVEQPCPGWRTSRRYDVGSRWPVAADEVIRLAEVPVEVARVAAAEGAADVAVLKWRPVGRRSSGAPGRGGHRAAVCGVLRPGDQRVGLAAEVALAGALPELQTRLWAGTLRLLSGDLVGRGGVAVADQLGVTRPDWRTGPASHPVAPPTPRRIPPGPAGGWTGWTGSGS
jgi:O-succinylbenzoate synthase